MAGLSLIVPAHNSGKFIGPFLKKYYEEFSKEFKPFELIVVCNGSTDNTLEICNSLKNEFPLKIEDIPQKGKGYALVRGFNLAKNEIIGFLDADNPFNLENVKNMLKSLGDYDIVIASKYVKGKIRIQDSQMRRFISIAGGVVAKVLFNLSFTDTQAGAKFFKREVWEGMDNNFICHGFDFDIEFLYKAKRKGFLIKEINIPFEYREFSTVTLKYLPGMLMRLLNLRFLK